MFYATTIIALRYFVFYFEVVFLCIIMYEQYFDCIIAIICCCFTSAGHTFAGRCNYTKYNKIDIITVPKD